MRPLPGTAAPGGMEGQDNRASLRAALRQLEAPGVGVPERMARAEACFRLAVLPDTGIDEAVALMRQALACDPYHPKMSFHLGRLLHKNGDPRAAVLEYRRALRLAPRSHRALVHLALALNDIGDEENRLGSRLLLALAAGEETELAGIVKEVDSFIAAWTRHELKPAVVPAAGVRKWEGSGNGKCRWQGLWKLFLVQELGRPKPLPKRITQGLDNGRDLVDGTRGAAEYVTACVLALLHRRDACRDLENRLRTPRLAEHKDRPAMRLAAAVCELGLADEPETFVDRASKLLEAKQVPPELVCCLHYCWYGKLPNLDPIRAAALIDRYPAGIRSLQCFRELRIAILDHYAQASWTEGRVDRARILWQEALALDPTRIGLAHNLAVAATREKAEERYASAWDRAVELRYLLAAAASDLRLQIEDRQRLHRSFAQQSRIRYLKPEGSSHGAVREREMQAWMEDSEAFRVWLREWDLYYVNARLRFHSPMHLLGVGLDCSDGDAEAGSETLVRQFELCFQDRDWAGTRVFGHVVRTLAAEACARAKDPLWRRRDPHFSVEMDEARLLAKETIEHGFLLFDLLHLAVNSPASNVQCSGLEAARHLLNMPWRSLEAAWRRGGGAADEALPVIFASYAIQLAKGTDSRHRVLRQRAIADCVQGSPEVHELRLYSCSLLLEERIFREAYETALAGFALLDQRGESDSAALEGQYAACLDRVGFEQLPAELRHPSPSQVQVFSEAARRVLAEYPKAGGLRLALAQLLIRSSDEDPARLGEASTILQESLNLLLTEEQILEAKQLLERAGAKSEAAEALQSIRRLLESSAEKARRAVEEWRQNRTPQKAREALRQLDSACDDAAQAEQVADAAKLPAAAEKARAALCNLEKLRAEIARN